MDTMNIVMKESTSQEILDVFGQNFAVTERWLITSKKDNTYVGYAGLKVVENSVIEAIIVLNDNSLSFEGEVLESLLNQSFYRMNARKVQVQCEACDRHKKELIKYFGFIGDHSMGDMSLYILYKEEYIRWLSKRGKTLSFLKPGYLRIVFVMIALFGLGLFGFDVVRKVNALKTIFYAYMTGVGAAGAFVCSWMSGKERTGEK